MSSAINKLIEISLGFSPCPNDTFMFDALVNGRIDSKGLKFNPVLEDVETLNRMAQLEKLDVTKMSFAAYVPLIDKYELLTSGSALGKGVGPLLISKKYYHNAADEMKRIAIPGKNTTAYFLFRMFYQGNYEITEMIFSDIEEAILQGKVDAGVIIHENRFTYEEKGLRKIADLGELWEKKTGDSIPLGGIAIRRSLEADQKKEINQLIRKSVEFAFAHPDASMEYVKKHSQEMSEEVMKKHIDLYVNKNSIYLGEEGKKSILNFISHGLNADARNNESIFIQD